MSQTAWTVHKFGGTSLADAGAFERAASIVAKSTETRCAVVVSAMAGVTDGLNEVLQLAETRSPAWRERLDAIRVRHQRTAEALLDAQAFETFSAQFAAEHDDIANVVHGVGLLRAVSQPVREYVTGHGEIWSARLLTTALHAQGKPVRFLDARQVLTVVHEELGPAVDWDASRSALATVLEGWNDMLVVSGFVARTREGVYTTLGRNGSDHSAAIFAALLDAQAIIIWTDVPGIMSADPRVVPEVSVIEELSYNEAMELAYFGAKVIHPQTMATAISRNIPIYIRNSSTPTQPGTRIGAVSQPGLAVKGITTIGGTALVNLEGSGVISVSNIGHRLFGALREAGVRVTLISQASSEHSICFAVPDIQLAEVNRAIGKQFANELALGQLRKLQVTRDCSILAVVGDNMAGTPGVAAKFFGALGKAGVNVRAIAQGSSERNISAVIDSKDAGRALRAVHGSFYLSPQTISIGLIGPGNIGSALLDQLAGEAARLAAQANLDLRVRGIASSSQMVLHATGVPLTDWRETLGREAGPIDIERFTQHVRGEHLPHAVIIDCTASEDVARRYVDWMRAGIHVITPNKRANTAEQAYYQALHEAGRRSGSHYLYETTVGAGLPVIQTLRDLRETGDEILRIEGIFSGTLAYLFNRFTGEQPFSAIVRAAREQGFTEPDPREDLSGLDVARKVVILGREMGLPLELADVEIDGLIPAGLEGGTVEEFLERLPEHDGEMNALLARAEAEGKVLRYVGRLDAAGQAKVRLEHLPGSHPFVHINVTDNIVQFVTRRYAENPLIVRGPGAGPDVTAGGVFADLLRLCAYLGARL